MKTKQIFWGLFFLSLGGLYLLEKYTAFTIDSFGIGTIWPILLILIGLTVILRETKYKPYLSGASGIFLALVIYGFSSNAYYFFSDEIDWDLKHGYTYNQYSEDYESETEECNLYLAGGLGKFTIEDTTDKLFNAETKGGLNDFRFTSNKDGNTADIKLRAREDVEISDFKHDLRSKVDISLNNKPVWNITLETGASDMYLDLNEYKVKNLDLETGASKTKIKFGDKYENVDLSVDMGVAKLEVYIPQNSGCKVRGDMALVSKDFNDFEKIDENGESVYVTKNYSSATNKIEIRANGGLSSFKIYKY